MRSGWLLGVVALASCGASELVPQPPRPDPLPGQCLEPDNASSPWLVGLNATDRQTIASSAEAGVVLVKQGECGTFKMLPDCYLSDLAYAWKPASTVQADAVEIATRQEMARKIPLAVAKYAAQMSSGERWSLDFATSGERSYAGRIETIDWSKLRDSCRGATHYAYKITTGAFQLSRSSAQEQARETEVGPADFESRARRDKLEQSEGGSYEACARGHDPARPACQGLLRLWVEPLPGRARPADARAGFGARLSEAGSVPVVQPLPTFSGPSGRLDKVDTKLLERLQAATRADKDGGVGPENKAQAWGELAGYEGDNPYKTVAAERQAAWKRVLEAEAARRAQAAKVCEEYSKDKVKLDGLLGMDDDVVSRQQKDDYQRELDHAYEPWQNVVSSGCRGLSDGATEWCPLGEVRECKSRGYRACEVFGRGQPSRRALDAIVAARCGGERFEDCLGDRFGHCCCK